MHHVTMRCNNKEFLFDDDSQELFLELLFHWVKKHAVTLYNYCVMTNHVHLLFQVWADDELSAFMHHVANVFARRFNRIAGRKGHLWEERFRSTIVQASTSFLRCMTYIDLNPVRAGIVSRPEDYPWSACRFVLEEDRARLSFHRLYRLLGKTPNKRNAAYGRLLANDMAREPFTLARSLFMGNTDFVESMQSRFGIVQTARPRIRLVDLSDGLVCVELQPGGGVAKHQTA